MKRSSRVILLFMGTATASGVSMGMALAKGACDHPVRPGFAMPGSSVANAARCMKRAGFGGSPHRFAQHFHSGGG
jgi:hypothetical protein